MNKEDSNLPKPIGTLDELLEEEDVGTVSRTVFVADNFGSRTFLLHVPIKEFYDCSEVANERSEDGTPSAQRKLNIPHARKLAFFLLKGLVNASIRKRREKDGDVPEDYEEALEEMGDQPYFAVSPIVCNLRSVKPQGAGIPGRRILDKETDETVGFKVRLSQKDVFWVVDGQHRRKAMQILFEFLEDVITTHEYAKGSLFAPADGRKAATDAELQLWQDCVLNARSTCKVSVERAFNTQSCHS